MELASKAISALNKASSNNTVINAFLVCGFVGLGVKSLNQQYEIEALESEKDSLLKTNKSLKKTVWDWKQQLYADANSSEKPFVPLSKLKSIFGELSTTPSEVEKVEGKPPASKILI